jgi:hypothetical protein
MRCNLVITRTCSCWLRIISSNRYNNLLSLFQQIHLVVFPHRCTFDGNIIALYGIIEPIISDLSNSMDAAYDVLSPESEAPQAQPDI